MAADFEEGHGKRDRAHLKEIAVRKNHRSGAILVKGLPVQTRAKTITERPRLRDGECALGSQLFHHLL